MNPVVKENCVLDILIKRYFGCVDHFPTVYLSSQMSDKTEIWYTS